MKPTQTLFIGCFLSVVGACREGDPIGATSDTLTVSCVSGVWASQETSCACAPRDSGLASAECQSRECRQSTIYFFDETRYFEAIVQRTSASFSAMGGPKAVSGGDWYVSGSTLSQVTPLPGREPKTWSTEATCDATKLQRVGVTGYSHPSAGLAAAIEDAARTGQWASHGYGP